MKTGVELIAIERQEQIEKHGFDNQYTKDHPEYYLNKQLVIAATELLSQHPSIMRFPESWDNKATIHRMASKSYKERLIIAGALIAAEIDRLQATGGQ